MSAPPPTSDINLLSECDGIVDFDAKVSNGALDLGVTEQQLHRPQVTRPSVDQRRLGPAQGMGPVH